MKFVTKKYTRPVIVSNLKKLNASVFTSPTTLANALSPRAGRKSAQFFALRSYVNLNKVFNSANGSSAKTLLIQSLQY